VKTKEREDRQRFKALVDDQRKILDKAEAEGRGLLPEEKEQYDRMQSDRDELRTAIDAYDERSRMKAELDSETVRMLEGEVRIAGGQEQPEPTPEQRLNPRETTEYRAAFARYMASGAASLKPEEVRALAADQDIYGGYLVAPLQMVNELLKAVDNQTIVRQMARVIPVPNADSLGVPSLDNDPADATWTKEIATGSEDSTMSVGKRELHPHPLAKRIKVSNKLLRASFMDVEGLVRDRLAYKFAVTEETAFMTGSGSGQPLGVFTASDNGISTGRDVSTDNTISEVKPDNLKRCRNTLKQQYWGNATWVFHRDVFGQIDREKDGNGQYLVQPNMQEGPAFRLLGFGVKLSEYAPNTMTTGEYVGVLGDFRFYWIADALDMQIQRLVELYAETNQTGFIGRLECDGMPVLEEAFVRVKLG